VQARPGVAVITVNLGVQGQVSLSPSQGGGSRAVDIDLSGGTARLIEIQTSPVQLGRLHHGAEGAGVVVEVISAHDRTISKSGRKANPQSKEKRHG
jgi:hypothetical protein